MDSLRDTFWGGHLITARLECLTTPSTPIDEPSRSHSEGKEARASRASEYTPKIHPVEESFAHDQSRGSSREEPSRKEVFARGVDGRWHPGRITGPAPPDYRQQGLPGVTFINFTSTKGPEVSIPAGAIRSGPIESETHDVYDITQVSMLGATHLYYSTSGVMRAVHADSRRLRFAGCEKAYASSSSRLFPLELELIGQVASPGIQEEFRRRSRRGVAGDLAGIVKPGHPSPAEGTLPLCE